MSCVTVLVPAHDFERHADGHVVDNGVGAVHKPILAAAVDGFLQSPGMSEKFAQALVKILVGKHWLMSWNTQRLVGRHSQLVGHHS